MGRGLQRAAAHARFPVGCVAVATKRMGQLDAQMYPVLPGERLRILGWYRLQEGINFYSAWRLDPDAPHKHVCVVDTGICRAPEPKEPT